MSRKHPIRNAEFGMRSSELRRSSALRIPHSTFRDGFTQVEMLIVVTIVGLLASVVIPTLSSTSGAVSLEAMARTLAADLRVMRQAAVQYNGTFAVTFDLANNSYTVKQLDSGGAPALVNVLSPGSSGNTISLDQFGAGRMHQSHIVIGGAALKVSKSSVADVAFNSTGSTGPGRTQNTVIWLSEGQGQNRRCILITVSWITGVVNVGDVQSYSPNLTMPNF